MPSTRRTFIKHIGTAGAALPLIMPSLVRAKSANGKLNIAGIGVGGRGWKDIQLVAPGHNIVAICDVDEGPEHLGQAAEMWPSARRYVDWRKLLNESNDIDAVCIGTPDHMHAPISMSAINLGKHVYCEKPLTHDVYEARQLRLAAVEAGVVTQMGNQVHASVGYRLVVQLVAEGRIGKVKEAHAWSDTPSWPVFARGLKISHPVPSTLHWDLWLGTAPKRDYIDGIYHPFNWRGWIDFGTGKQGDMACHIIDPVKWSLELADPLSIRVESPAPYPETYPAWRIAHYKFPGTKHTAGDTVNVTWYDGGLRPPIELARMPAERNLPKQGILLVGEEGSLVISHSPTAPQLYPLEKFPDFRPPTLEPLDHHQQWTSACVGEGKTASSFDYAGPLTEAVLLGNVGMYFAGRELEWDAANLRFTNEKLANKHIRREYRKGWEVKGL